jgi:phosphoglycerate dehydrogenase-like enzyme
MTTIFVSRPFRDAWGAELDDWARARGLAIDTVLLPPDPEQRASAADAQRIEVALFSSDVFPDGSRSFYSTLRKAPALRWLQLFNAGIDAPIFAELMARGVRLTTASGTNAEAVANSALAGLLALARGVPRWIAQQREHVWRRTARAAQPPDLRGQRLLLIGAGPIAAHIGGVAGALGLEVAVVRRDATRVPAWARSAHPPGALAALLPATDWLVVACPLTAETRRLIDARALALLPPRAHLVNVGRGEIVDEAALVEALRSGRVAGAYLDVFEREPLPPDSPLWDLPNVLLSPHDAASSAGNDRRVYELFRDNLGRWLAGEPLVNEARP